MSEQVTEDVAVDLFDGATGGNDTSTVNDNLSVVAADMGVPEELVKEFAAGDEKFAALVQGEEDTSKSDGEDNASGEEPEENSAAGSEPDTEAKPSADDKIPAGKSDDTPVEFADDVIRGIKAKDFEKLSDDARVALAEFYNESQAKAAKADEAEARISRLLDDPVVRARATAIEAGRPADLQVRGMTAVERKSISAAIQDRLSLDESEVEEILSIVGGGIENVAKDMAQDLANRSIAAQDSVRREAEIQKQGNELLRGLSQYNKSLEVQETDLTKFYKFSSGKIGFNESHPEIEKFKNGLGKISMWAGQNGIDNRMAIQMGAKAFYAAAAAALDMPVALNTKERDAKIAATAKQKALAPFLKSAKSNTLNTQGTDSTVNRNIAEGVIRDGFDITKLATDAAYYDATIRRFWGNEEKLARIDELTAQGQALIDKQNRR